ncbi:hypothetical protein B0H13DRAFT_1888543 [Mycena leptocephala]|nr:hypothetical protein B0H13DRAFT_1888543 [Mycena leptocephala]
MALELLLPSRGMRLLLKVVVSPRIFSLLYRRLNSLAVSYQPARSHILRVIVNGNVAWRIDPLIADGFWLSARQLAQFIVSAAHGVNFLAHAVPAVPITLPTAALADVSLPIPSILLALSHPSNPLRHCLYASPENAVAECLLFSEWFDDNLCWLAEAIRRDFLKGKHSAWNYAPVLEIGEGEYYGEIADARADVGLDELAVLLSTIEEAPSDYNRVDFDVAEIIHPHCSHFVVAGNSAEKWILLYPVESEVNCTVVELMDQFLWDGIEVVELEMPEFDAMDALGWVESISEEK